MKPRSKSKKGAKAAKAPRKKSAAPTAAKPAKSAGAATEKVKPSEVRNLTPASVLNELLRTCRGLKGNMDTINGELREKIGYAKSKKYLYPKAFAELRKLDKMAADDPAKAAEYWDTLLAYMDATGVMATIEAVGRLPLENETIPRRSAAAKPAPKPAPAPKAANGAKAPPAPAAVEAKADPPTDDDGKVSRPHFGQAAGTAPGGPVHMLPGVAKH